MRKSDLDKRSILIFNRGQFKALLATLAILVLGACATPPATESDPAGAEAPSEPAADDAELELKAEELATDPGVLFHILAAERLGAVGEYEEALDHYLDAAEMSDDPEIAEQVTRLGAGLGEWPVVIRGAERWLELVPDSRAARQIYVVALLRQGKSEMAAEVLAASISAAEDTDQAWRESISLLASAQPDELAETALQQLIDAIGVADQPSLVALQQSRLAWQLGEEQRAFELAEEAAGLDDAREKSVWAARLAMASDAPERALHHYRRARAKHPDDVELALSEAEVLRQMDDMDGALDALEDLPPGAEVLYTRGSYLNAAGRHEEAVDAWHKLAAIEAENPPTHAYYTGFLAEQLGLDEQARAWYGRVESGRLKPRADLRRAGLSAEAGDLDEALALLRGLRSEDNALYEEQSYLTESQILTDAGKAGQALDVLSGALRELPESIPLLYGRALTAVELDDLELAEQDLRAILYIESDNAIALNALGYTLTDRTDRHREAYRLIRRAYELEPDNPAIQDSMGWVYFRMGQPGEALPYLRRALEGDYHPEIAAHLGEVLIELGEVEEGWAVLEEAREEFPEDEYLADTVERMGLDR